MSGAGESKRERPLVLVVEDDPHDWEIYGKILWYNGFDVLYAADGARGLELAEEHDPDVVLLDVGLPDMTGLDLCRALQAGGRAMRAQVVVLSARPKSEYEDRVRAAGCVAYLEKPVSPTAVLHEVERLAGRPPRAGEGRPPRLTGSEDAA